jgi:transcriptional regulator with XRE-family HTH domain
MAKEREELTLTQVLKEKIRACGLSLNELSQATGVANSQLSRFMRGRSLSMPNVEKLLSYFDLTITQRVRRKQP